MRVENAARRTIQVRIKAAAELMDKVFPGWARVVKHDLQYAEDSLEQVFYSLGYCSQDLCGGRIPADVDKAFPSVQEYDAGKYLFYLNAWKYHVLNRVANG